MSFAAAAVSAHQRACGSADLVLAAAPGGARLRHLFHAAPLRILFPDTDPGDPTLGAVVNVAGGLAGGDDVASRIALLQGARFTATTPAAEKIYRSLGEETRIRATIEVAEEACCEWLPQETILFDGARLRRSISIDLASSAWLLASEMLVLGRAARGERLTNGAVLDAWRVRIGGRLAWADAFRIVDPRDALAERFALGGVGAIATLLLAGPAASRHRALARDLSDGGASLVAPGLLLVRWAGEAGAVRVALADAIRGLRHAAFGHPARLPRLWRT